MRDSSGCRGRGIRQRNATPIGCNSLRAGVVAVRDFSLPVYSPYRNDLRNRGSTGGIIGESGRIARIEACWRRHRARTLIRIVADGGHKHDVEVGGKAGYRAVQSITNMLYLCRSEVIGWHAQFLIGRCRHQAQVNHCPLEFSPQEAIMDIVQSRGQYGGIANAEIVEHAHAFDLYLIVDAADDTGHKQAVIHHWKADQSAIDILARCRLRRDRYIQTIAQDAIVNINRGWDSVKWPTLDHTFRHLSKQQVLIGPVPVSLLSCPADLVGSR